MRLNLHVRVHAMETPHDGLFVFKPGELKSLGLATTAAAAPSATTPRPMPGKARS